MKPNELPPSGAVVISTEEACSQKNVIAQVEPYTLYVASSNKRARAPLPDGAFRAQLEVISAPSLVAEGTLIEMRVKVRNISDTTWPGCERGSSNLQIYLGSHWLDANGKWSREEGRTPLRDDLGPGKEAILKFALNAPTAPGDYNIELDLLQEGITWFAIKGSTPTVIKIHVE